jgi:DNA-directed RNA polymerase specialized sigma24 family protein
MNDLKIDPAAELLSRALGGDADAMRSLVSSVLPVVEARAVYALRRAPGARLGRDVHQEVDDLAQEVFAALFAEQGRALRLWDPTRGLSFKNFVGLLAARQIATIMRTGRRSPWTEEPTDDESLDFAAGPSQALEAMIGSRELFAVLLERVREEVSPRGMHLFHALVVEERPVEDVCADFEMTRDAVYAWRSRLLATARKLLAALESEQVASDPGASNRTRLQDGGA